MESRSQPQSTVNDDWDSVVNFEGRMFENGRNDGCTDAIQSGEMYQNGVQAGFLKGLKISNLISDPSFHHHVVYHLC
jgi:hypothetical protein